MRRVTIGLLAGVLILVGATKVDPVKVARNKAIKVLEDARKGALRDKDKGSAYAVNMLIGRLRQPVPRLLMEKTFSDLRKLKWEKVDRPSVARFEFDTGIRVKKAQVVQTEFLLITPRRTSVKANRWAPPICLDVSHRC